MKSIISNERECLICKNTQNLHKHHFFPGNPNRKISERYGLWGYFCAYHHNMSNDSVHFDRELREKWQRSVQEQAMQHYGWTVDDFIREFGASCLGA